MFDLVLFDLSYKYRVSLAILELARLDDVELFPDQESVMDFLLAEPAMRRKGGGEVGGEELGPNSLVPTVLTTKLNKVEKAMKRAEGVIRGTGKK